MSLLLGKHRKLRSRLLQFFTSLRFFSRKSNQNTPKTNIIYKIYTRYFLCTLILLMKLVHNINIAIATKELWSFRALPNKGTRYNAC